MSEPTSGSPPAKISRPGEAGAPGAKTDLLGHPRARLAEILADRVDQPYRVEQVFHALYRDRVGDLMEITTLKRSLREELAESFSIGRLVTREKALSSDGTVKYLFELTDGATIETVDIPERRRRTVCVSSQAGCALACSFCVTGFWGAGRNLTAGEIIAQVFAVEERGREVEGCEQNSPEHRSCEKQGADEPRPVNLVFMGMGEPLQNLESLEPALEILTDSIPWRRITVSTAGIIPGIERMAGWPQRPNLAISLHAPDDERRNRVMPINRTYPLRDLLASLRRYPLERGRRVTFEYILIRDFNDQGRDAEALANLLGGLVAKVNLIPINPDPVLGARMVPPDEETIGRFCARLRARGLFTTVRSRRGDDVQAACGQLRAPGKEPRGFRRSNLSL